MRRLLNAMRMPRWQGRRRRFRTRARASLLAALVAVLLVACLLASSLLTSKHSSLTIRRWTQQSTVDTAFLTTNSASTLRALERHLFSPAVQDEIDRIFTSRVVHDGSVHTFPSFKYSLRGFWRNWERMALEGVPTGNPNVGSGGAGGSGRFVLFAGDDVERRINVTLHPKDPKRPFAIHGFEYGLANMAAFLSQAMVDGIHGDACDESNEQEMLARSGQPTGIFPLSNACGQWNTSYEDMVCPEGEKEMECDPLPPEKNVEATYAAGRKGLKCGPVSMYPGIRNHKNDKGRTDASGCCWWGRGPIHTKGPCSMGKGRPSLDFSLPITLDCSLFRSPDSSLAVCLWISCSVGHSGYLAQSTSTWGSEPLTTAG